MKLLEIKNLNFKYRSRKNRNLLDFQIKERRPIRWTNISMNVSSGDCIVLVGPSGVGKSTLLNLIAGTYELAHTELMSGEIIHRNPDGIVLDSILQKNVGLCLQNGLGLQPYLSVESNVEFPLKHHPRSQYGKEPDLRRQRLDYLAHKFWLFNAKYDPQTTTNSQALFNRTILTKKIQNISGGQRQRVALARCFALNRRIYLLDEPFDGQDNPLRQKLVHEVRSEIARAKREKKDTAYIIITHRQNEALSLADEIIFLGKKESGNIGIIGRGTPKELYQTPPTIYIATFFGSAMINSFDSKYITSDVGLEQRKEHYIIAVRPEHLHIAHIDEEVDWQPVFYGKIVENWYEGERTMYEVNIDGQADLARAIRHLRGGHKYKIDDRVKVGWNRDDIHCFDKETGMRVSQR